MPIYEYQCTTCDHDFDKLQKIGAEAPPCPECGADVRKKVSASAFVLKGSGWYRDHYGLKKTGAKPEAGGSTGGDKPVGGDKPAGGGGTDAGSASTSAGSSSSSGSAKTPASEG